MFAKMKMHDESALDTAIDEAIRYLDPGDDDYLEKIQGVERLMKLKDQESRSKLSPDTIAIVLGNLIGILLILKYEKLEVVTSKALNFVIKLK